MLQRWIDLDRALGSFEGLRISEFARRWKVSPKTVRRDLAVFRAMGQKAVCVLGLLERQEGEGPQYRWQYDVGVEWLFVRNIPPKLRAKPRG